MCTTACCLVMCLAWCMYFLWFIHFHYLSGNLYPYVPQSAPHYLLEPGVVFPPFRSAQHSAWTHPYLWTLQQWSTGTWPSFTLLSSYWLLQNGLCNALQFSSDHSANAIIILKKLWLLHKLIIVIFTIYLLIRYYFILLHTWCTQMILEKWTLSFISLCWHLHCMV